jgi:hypothetical protein
VRWISDTPRLQHRVDAVPEFRLKASIVGVESILMGAYQLHYGLSL